MGLSVAFTRGIGGHHQPNQGATDEWLTPPPILQPLGKFDLDPCAPINRPWDTAANHYTIADDGLSKPWFGRVWLNPPYGPQTGKWLKILAHTHRRGTALIFARTETRFFFESIWHHADALLFIKGRLYFHHLDGSRSKKNAGGPSVLIAYSAFDVQMLADSKIPGRIVELKQERTPV